ncbi:MAG: polysaccharide deacetylase family protein [Lachnospiraceae bacterium]|nr:polysaccharide deacetylase family protein [Lachnospiraceae bacterium]
MTKNQLLKKRQKVKQRQRAAMVVIPLAVFVLVFLLTRPLFTKVTRRPVQEPEQKEETQTEEILDTDTAVVKAASDDMKGAPGWNVSDSGWWYLNDDMTTFTGGWKTIDGQRYYFKDSGYMATGWVNTGTVKDSYFDANGILDTSKQQKLVALTYDDGPSANTDKVLDALEKYGAKATFFVVGMQADYYTSQLQREYDLGMEIGNHSYTHPWLNQLTPDEIDEELSHDDEVISKVTGSAAALVRPTGGGISANVLESINRPLIQWDVDTLDWEHLDADQTYDRAMRLVQDGSIILMHDLFAPSADCADRMISSLQEEGYKLVTVSELAEAYGYDLEPGGQYYAFYPGGCEENRTKQQGLDEIYDA